MKDKNQSPAELLEELENLRFENAVLKEKIKANYNESAEKSQLPNQNTGIFQQLVERSSDLLYIYRLKPTRGFEYVSPSATTITGYTPKDHYNDPDLGFKLIHPDDMATLQTLSGGQKLDNPLILRWLKKNGDVIWTETITLPIFDSTGEVVAIQGRTTDITLQKKTLNEIEDAKNRLELIFNTSPDAIMLTHVTDGFIMDCNKAFLVLTGYERSEIVGKTTIGAKIWSDIAQRDAFIQLLHKEGFYQNFESNFKVKDGTVFTGLISASIINLSGNDCILSVTRDITERKKVEETQLFLLNNGYLQPTLSFYESLAQHLAKCLDMDYVCIDKLKGALLSAQTVAIYYDGKFEDNVEYTLKDAPCGDVVGNNLCCFPSGVRHLFPSDIVLQEMLAESYVGTTLWSSKGKAIGLIAIIGRKQLKNKQLTESILKLVSIRAAAELERTWTEETLNESKYEMQRAQQLANIGSWTFDPVKQEFYWSKEMFRIWGLDSSMGEFAYKDHQKYIHPDDYQVFDLAVKDAIELGKPYRLDLRIIRPDGVERNIITIFEPILNAKGKVIRLRGTNQDVTSHKKVEETLRQTNEYLENLFNYANAPIIVWDNSLKINRFNHAFEQLSGYNAEEVISRKIDMLFPADKIDYSLQQIRKTTGGEKWKTVEIQILKKYGEIRTVLWNSANVLDNNGLDIVATIAQGQDITERKLAEIQIQEQNIKLQELNATKDKFFSIIAHDLRSPFSSILGLSDLLVQNINKYDHEKIKRFVINIKNSSTNAFKLLENLLEWSRLQRGMITPNLLTYNLKSIVYEVLLISDDAQKAKKLFVANSIISDCYVVCDIDMLKTVLRNLISNAIKFTNPDGYIIISATEYKSHIELFVNDNGVGISAERLPFLFSIEKNVSTKGTADEAGTGLGLLLCKELMEKQGGRIWAESVENKGTTFFLRLNK